MRALPASILVAGDITPDDDEIIEQINMVLAQKRFSYRLQRLSSEQIVVLAPEHSTEKREGELLGIATGASMASAVEARLLPRVEADGARVVYEALCRLGRNMETNNGSQSVSDADLIEAAIAAVLKVEQ